MGPAPRLTAEQVVRLREVLLEAFSVADPDRRDALLAAGTDLPLHPGDWLGRRRPAVGDDRHDGLDQCGDGLVAGEDR